MALDQAFLDDILANPEDDTPRLIYADWLDDHGDHDRAEFIRLQIQLAGMSEDDPCRLDLIRRERDLLAVHEEQWLGPVAAFVKSQTFRRGFLHSVGISAEDFSLQADELFRLAPVRELWLEHPASGLREAVMRPQLLRVHELNITFANLDDEGVRVLAGSPFLTELRKLGLSDNNLSPVAGEALGRANYLPRLVELDLDSITDRFNAIGGEGVRMLVQNSGFPALRILRLERNAIGDAGLSSLASSPLLAQLHRLSLKGNRISDIEALTGTSVSLTELNLKSNELDADAAALLATWPGMASLSVLDLSFNPIGAAGLTALARSPLLANLKTLDVSGTTWRDEGDQSGTIALLRSPHLRSLKTLDLYYCKLGKDSLVALANAETLTNLTSLDLGSNSLGGVGLRVLVNAPFQRSLRSLQIPNAELKDEGMRELMRWPCLGQLRELSLWENRLGPEDMRAFAAWPEPSRLTSLTLSDNQVGDEGAAILAKLPQLAGLSYLALEENEIGELGALALASSPHLKGLLSLSMEKNKISERGQAALRERFGDRVSF